ncbi:syntaxin [Aspergillus sclerotioniger CBS 115572]|uniref:Syntaxin n=1 Tax=Aspergillus sclerotioniger CBS 115572 TaxID=1450535 RepID=A0A317VBP3_9EURO|nr:syntaxin [Aspergillus sclerotioniger CBS 115572]PWY70372.1 syntaxin [Aspergillus sclerotioniger CBS 115572]
MASISDLQVRLKELSAALAQIQPLVARLKGFTTAVGQGDQARLELGTEIHTRLKEAEEQLELLKVEVEGLESGADPRRKGLDSEKESERERIVALAGRLAEDLKRTRGDFRNAQLQAKRNAEVARRKERELLFTRSQSAERKKQSTEKLTQDDIVVNASNDVTAALRRTHQLMQAELSRSQFAQETLEQSTAAISSLSESYTDLDTLISSSRNLIGSLLRSQKSDTWYLETAFYILIGTIAWLVFRRILYGPMWWLVWLPLRLFGRFTFAILGTVGITSKAVQASESATVVEYVPQETPIIEPKVEPNVQSADSEAVWDQVPVMDEAEEDRLIDEIGEMVEESEKQEETNIDDISEEERQRQAELPRNPKKRMFEATDVPQQKDEL